MFHLLKVLITGFTLVICLVSLPVMPALMMTAFVYAAAHYSIPLFWYQIRDIAKDCKAIHEDINFWWKKVE